MGENMIAYRRMAMLLLLPMFLTSCSNVKSYRSDIEKNFRIEPKISSGFDARLDIFDVDSKCELDYAGSVELGHGSVDIGVPVNRPVYMELMLFKPAGLFSSASTTTYPIFLNTRSGQKYVADVSYVDNFYKFRLREGGRVIDVKSLESCKKSKVN
jgi:hypothetical protein